MTNSASPPEKYRYATIPALNAIAPGLGDVPGCDGPNFKDPDAAWRRDPRTGWFPWRDRLAPVRTRIHLECLKSPEMQRRQRELCRRDWAYFAAMFGWTYDPRHRKNEGLEKPFYPFAIQVNKIQEVQRILATPEKIDIFDSKARGIGWTDTYATAALAAWLLTDPGYALHFVSFKEDKVYKRNDRSTIFGKIEYKISKLPEWLLPAGFSFEENMLRLNLHNPQNGASITGESTTGRTARGDRYTGIFYDEAAFVEGGFYDVYEVGAGTTDHRFAWSTESWQYGDDWEMLWQTEIKEGDPNRVWQIDWWHNAYQDTAWFAEEKNRFKGRLHIFAREYERNPEAAESSIIYPQARDVPHTDNHFEADKTLIVSMDPGHADDTAIVWGQPIRRDGGGQGIRWLGSYERNRVPVAFYAHLLTGIPPAPEDECWAMWQDGGFSDRDRRLMAWFKQRRAAAGNHEEFTRWCMDPAGKQEHAGTSFHGLFYNKTQALLAREWTENGSKGPKPKGIAPNYKYLQEQGNLIVDRVLCTRNYLPFSEFSVADPELWRAVDIQDALRRSKYSEPTDRSISQPKPIHGDESHKRSAVEFASTYLYLGMIDPPKRIARRMLNALKEEVAA
jgi:hypothetical protein